MAKTKYQSKFEGIVHAALKKFKSILVGYETERLWYYIPARKARYTPDFVLTNKDKTKKIYVETKGYLRPADRTKMTRVKKDNPELDIRIIFQKDLSIKGTQMTYTSWAERYGFPYAVGPTDKVIKQWVKALNAG